MMVVFWPEQGEAALAYRSGGECRGSPVHCCPDGHLGQGCERVPFGAAHFWHVDSAQLVLLILHVDGDYA